MPVCSGTTVTERNSLASLYPDVAKDWHPTKNGDATPERVKKASGTKVWWKCSRDPSHEWEAVVRNRTTLGSGCPYCDAEKKYLRLTNSQFDSFGSGTDYHRVFAANIQNIRKLLKGSNFAGTRLEQAFLRMNYAAAITALETYLSDAFFDSVITSDDKLNRLFRTDPEFASKKYSIDDAMTWATTFIEKALEHLQKVVWHNVARVAHLYRNVLAVEIPIDDEEIQRAIAIRHDIVHRNGRTKSGRSIIREETEIDKILSKICDYVADIDRQFSAKN